MLAEAHQRFRHSRKVWRVGTITILATLIFSIGFTVAGQENAHATTPAEPSTWTLLAAGERAKVLSSTSSYVSTGSNTSNGTYWYNNGNAIGFSPTDVVDISLGQGGYRDRKDLTTCNSSNQGDLRFSVEKDYYYSSGVRLLGSIRVGCLDTYDPPTSLIAFYHADTQPTYYPNGPQKNVSNNLSSNGWTRCSIFQASSTTPFLLVTNVGAPCDKAFILVAAKSSYQSAPTVSTFSSSATTPRNDSNASYSLVFSQSVTGLAAEDFENAGTATECSYSVTGSGTTYTLSISSCSDGTIQPRIKTNSVSGSTFDGPASAATTTSTITKDSVAPAASVTAATILASGNASVQSSEAGTAYLVNETVTVTSLVSITGAADNLQNSVSITTANNNTNLSATGLVPGTYKLYTIDGAGNLSAASTNTISIKPGTPGTPDLDAASDLGTSNTDNSTSDETPTFSLSSVVSGASVTLTAMPGSGNPVTCSFISTGTSGSCTFPSLSNSTYSIAAVQSFGGINSETSTALANVVINKTTLSTPAAPDMASASDLGRSNSDDITSDSTPTINTSGSFTGTATVTAAKTGSTSVTCNVSSSTCTLGTLSDGSWSITATDTDSFGNSSISSSISITIDTVAPTKPIVDELYVTDGTRIMIQSSEVGSAKISNGAGVGTALVAINSANSPTEITVSVGRSMICPKLYVYDLAGNESQASDNAVCIYDVIAPTSLVATPSNGGVSISFTQPSPTNSAVITNYYYSTNGTSFTALSPADSTSPISITGLTNGTAYSITIKALYSTGGGSLSNPSSTVSVTPFAAPGTPDLDAASDLGTSNTDNNTSDDTPTFSLSSLAANAAVTLTATRSGGGSATCSFTSTGSSGSCTFTSLPNGTYSLSAQQTLAGVTSAASSSLTNVVINKATIDTPSVPDLADASDSGISNTDNITRFTTPTISVSGTFTGTRIIRATKAGSSDVTCTVSSGSCSLGTLTEGVWNVIVTNRDTPGNEATSSALSITVDASRPTLTYVGKSNCSNSPSAICALLQSSEIGTAYLEYGNRAASTGDTFNLSDGSAVSTVVLTANTTLELSASGLSRTNENHRLYVEDIAGNLSFQNDGFGKPGSASAPGTPTSVSASITGSTTATVSFSAPAANGGSAITGYTVTSTPSGAVCAVGANSTTYNCTGLAAGTSYTFKVKATNTVGSGSDSSPTTSAVTLVAPTLTVLKDESNNVNDTPISLPSGTLTDPCASNSYYTITFSSGSCGKDPSNYSSGNVNADNMLIPAQRSAFLNFLQPITSFTFDACCVEKSVYVLVQYEDSNPSSFYVGNSGFVSYLLTANASTVPSTRYQISFADGRIIKRIGLAFNSNGSSSPDVIPTDGSASTPHDITIYDNFGFTVSQLATSVSVSSKSLTAATAATSFTPITASGGGSSKTYSISPSLPAGLSLNASTGAITGTPTGASASTSYTVSVTDGSSTSTATFSLGVNAALSSTTGTVPSGVYKDVAVTAFTPISFSGGTSPISYAVSPSLPAGLTLNTSTGVISGTATGTSANTTYTVTATDANGDSEASTFAFAVTDSTTPSAPAIGAATSTSATTAVIEFLAPNLNGGSTITRYIVRAYSESGISTSLTGEVNQSGSGSALISGLSPNTKYKFKVEAINSVGPSAASEFSNQVTTAEDPSVIAAQQAAAAEAARQAELARQQEAARQAAAAAAEKAAAEAKALADKKAAEEAARIAAEKAAAEAKALAEKKAEEEAARLAAEKAAVEKAAAEKVAAEKLTADKAAAVAVAEKTKVDVSAAATAAVEKATAAAAAKVDVDTVAAAVSTIVNSTNSSAAITNKITNEAAASISSAPAAATKAASTASANTKANSAASQVRAAATAAQKAATSSQAQTSAAPEISLGSSNTGSAAAQAAARANAAARAGKAAANEVAATAEVRAVESKATATALQNEAKAAVAEAIAEQKVATALAVEAKAAADKASTLSAEKIAATTAAKTAAEILVELLKEKVTVAEKIAAAVTVEALAEAQKSLDTVNAKIAEAERTVAETASKADAAISAQVEAVRVAEAAKASAEAQLAKVDQLNAVVPVKAAAAVRAASVAAVDTKIATAAKAAAAKVPSKAVISAKPAAPTGKNSTRATISGLKPGQKVKVTVNVKPKP